MYIPKHFEITEWSQILPFVAEARSADLITVDSSGQPLATLMPCNWIVGEIFEDEYGWLLMHMSKANEQWKSILPGAKGLAIIRGPQAYISPTNYEHKTTDHKVVPTWNYQAVHLSGTVEISEDIEVLRGIVTDLTQVHEAGREKSWSASESDPTYFEAQLRGIVAVTLKVTKVEAVYKLSQNRSAEDRKRIADDLSNSALPEERLIAEQMKRQL